MCLSSLVQISNPFKCYGGKAKENGFYIYKGGKFEMSLGFNLLEESLIETKKFSRLFIGIYLPCIFLVWLVPLIVAKINAWPIFVCSAIFTFLSVASAFTLAFAILCHIYKKGQLEYHACEHKTIALLERGLPLTLENLKKMPRLDSQCGTISQGIIILLPLAYIVLTLVFSPEISLPLFCYIILALFGFLFPFLLQLFLTREPTEDKLDEALGVAKAMKFKEDLQA